MITYDSTILGDVRVDHIDGLIVKIQQPDFPGGAAVVYRQSIQ